MKPSLSDEAILFTTLGITFSLIASIPLGVGFAEDKYTDFKDDKGCFAHGGPICHEICQDVHTWFWFGHREICVWQPITRPNQGNQQ